jgi:hypothetical protein
MTDEAKPDRRKSTEFREACRVRAQAQWTPAARAAQGALTREKLKSPVIRERISDRTRQAFADPEVRKRHVNGVRVAMAQPAVRERISAATKAGMARWRERQLATLRETWRKTDAQTRAKFLLEVGATGASAAS